MSIKYNTVDEFLNVTSEMVDPALRRVLEGPVEAGEELRRAMEYTLFAPAKRFRPALALASAHAVSEETDRVVPFMVALELMHTYSLIHDELPCMDDDDLRRGKATSHRVFGEGMAVLAGDALQALSFAEMARAALSAADGGGRELRAMAELAEAAGLRGMAGGQALDLAAEGDHASAEDVERIHRLKTGALMKASTVGGGHLGGAREHELECLGKFGLTLGMAFQAAEDILNVKGDSDRLGKGVGTDRELEKATLPRALGMKRAEERARELAAECERSLEPLGEKAILLRDLARFAVDREK